MYVVCLYTYMLLIYFSDMPSPLHFSYITNMYFMGWKKNNSQHFPWILVIVMEAGIHRGLTVLRASHTFTVSFLQTELWSNYCDDTFSVHGSS